MKKIIDEQSNIVSFPGKRALLGKNSSEVKKGLPHHEKITDFLSELGHLSGPRMEIKFIDGKKDEEICEMLKSIHETQLQISYYLKELKEQLPL